jgi:hypothetical protein
MQSWTTYQVGNQGRVLFAFIYPATHALSSLGFAHLNTEEVEENVTEHGDDNNDDPDFAPKETSAAKRKRKRRPSNGKHVYVPYLVLHCSVSA